MPELLDKPVSLIGDAEIFAFRNARAREGKVVVELVGGVKAKRRVPAKALPGQATMALNRGFTAPIVMALGGWKTGRMMRRYAAVTDETPRNAAEAGRDRGFESRRGHHSTTSYCLEGLTGQECGHFRVSDGRSSVVFVVSEAKGNVSPT
jgi:hypothetical protein